MNPEDLLTDALRDRVERTDYPSTPLSTVAGRAGAIRARRRRTTSLAAAAAVAVVVVPGAVWLGRSPDGTAQPGGTLSSGPTGSPTEQTSAPAGSALEDLPLGSKPGIDYLVGDTYVTMNGDRITSPAFGTARTATPVRGGILTAEAHSPGQIGPFSLSRIALVVDGNVQALGCGTASFAMSTDGTQSAYWLADSCTLGGGGKLYSGVNNTMGESGPGYFTTPAGAIDVPVGIVQQGILINDVGADRGNGPSPLLVTWDGTTTPLGGLGSVAGSDENNDVVSGSLNSDSNTGAVVDVPTGAVKWSAPGWQLGQFSNDGKYVLAQRLDASAGYTIFDAVTGNRIVQLDPLGDDVVINQIAWDFDDTLLAVASDGQQEAIVRFDLQGHVTRATATKPATDGTDVYRLATRP
jgi:hypothetical protein